MKRNSPSSSNKSSARRARTLRSFTGGSLTISQYAEYIAPGKWDKNDFVGWPPDVFALAASLLLKSGAYSRAVSGWKRDKPLEQWVRWIANIGKRWRANPSTPPNAIRKWHRVIISKNTQALPVLHIAEHARVYDALLHLCAAADEACVGVGFGRSNPEPFLVYASWLLFRSGEDLGVSTLCLHVDHAAARVLPKLHTPQSGITIRSLTHHLALCPAADVKVKWAENPCVKRHYFNLLVAPWPLATSPADFRQVEPTSAELQEMPDNFGFFEYNPSSKVKPSDQPLRRLKSLIQQARRTVSEIHGVIFPEGALTLEQHRQIRDWLVREDIFLIAGVRAPSPSRGKAGVNCLRIDIPVDLPHGKYVGSHEQSKHHRWFLDKRQIVQYGLGSCLDVRSKWWEHISIGDRVLYFVVLDDWLTICPLICEDLARQDPVSDIVRAIGPNLVVAILMDGPQMTSRWPARYATVLAEDPGSSVLTLTSVGMSALSRPPGKERSRAVVLWKDAKSSEANSIDLPDGADGLVLSLSREREKEWSADGRDDNAATGYPILSGVHVVTVKPD